MPNGESGSVKQKVREDLALGNKMRVTSTPTKVINDDIIIGSSVDNVLEQYLMR
jgi:protein-disulfide isomerase